MPRILLMVIALFGLAIGAQAAPPPPVGPDDIVLGRSDAPVTVIEYASLTCPHCANWQTTVFPEVKRDFIDTGKIRFVFRDYPLDGLALRAGVLARCGGPQRAAGLVDQFFRQQSNWARSKDPIADLIKQMRFAALSEEQAKTCLADPQRQNAIVASRQSGDAAGVDSTPYFFINGKGRAGEISLAEFAKLVQAAGS